MALSKQEQLEAKLIEVMKLAQDVAPGSVIRVQCDFQASGYLPYQILQSDDEFPFVGAAVMPESTSQPYPPPSAPQRYANISIGGMLARTGVSVTKSVTFRGVAQEFSNTYFYNSVQGSLSSTEAEALLDAVVAKERSLHGAAITFVRGKVWSAGGTKEQNNMLFQKALSGTGTGAVAQGYGDPERAFLVRHRAGVDSKGRPVYLRKWWHLHVGTINGEVIAQGAWGNISQLSATQRAFLVTAAQGFKDITAQAVSHSLVAESGRGITGTTEAHPFIEHHQLGDMWRG